MQKGACRDAAIGHNSIVDADGSTAVGNNVHITANGTIRSPLARIARRVRPQGTVIGQGASVTAGNALTLGQGSVADRANLVSLEPDTADRQVTHVAAGSAATDGVNVQQLNSLKDWSKTYTDQRMGAVTRSE
jgi:autotransporter adhesin